MKDPSLVLDPLNEFLGLEEVEHVPVPGPSPRTWRREMLWSTRSR